MTVSVETVIVGGFFLTNSFYNDKRKRGCSISSRDLLPVSAGLLRTNEVHFSLISFQSIAVEV